MQSLLMAISDFIAKLLYKPKKVVTPAEPTKEPKYKVPAGYRPLYFHCWLCKGRTNFAVKNSIRKKKFTMECSWCGIENTVMVNSPPNDLPK